MGGACSTYAGEACTGLWWGTLWETDDLEDQGAAWEIILKWFFRM